MVNLKNNFYFAYFHKQAFQGLSLAVISRTSVFCVTLDGVSFCFQVAANTPSMYSQELFQLSQYLQVKVNLEYSQSLRAECRFDFVSSQIWLRKYWLDTHTKEISFQSKEFKNRSYEKRIKKSGLFREDKVLFKRNFFLQI